MITARGLILQSILYFMLAKISGESRERAISKYINSPLCSLFGEHLTVGHVYQFAETAGYE